MSFSISLRVFTYLYVYYLSLYFQNFQYDGEESSTISLSSSESSRKVNGPVSSRVLHDVLCMLAAVPVNNNKEGEQVALQSLLIAHHPIIRECGGT